jgi:drug/metabolite transporter (DMT)-like permease
MPWGILFAIISNLSFGISNVYWNRAAIDDHFSRIVFYRGILTLLFLFLFYFLTRFYGLESICLINFQQPDWQEIAVAVILCGVCSLGLVFYLQSLRYSPVSISVSLSSINIFSILTAVWVLGEVFKPVYYLAFLLAGTGVWLIKRQEVKSIKGWNKGTLLSLLASLIWGVTYTLFKIPAKTLGPLPLAILLESSVVVAALIWNMFAATDKRVITLPNGQQIKHFVVLALLVTGGTLFFNLALQSTDVLVLSLLGNLSLVTSVLLGITWQKDKISRLSFVGLILILLSLVLVQIA